MDIGFPDEGNEYYAFSPLKSEIKPHQIWHYVRKMQRDGCKSFNEEFQVCLIFLGLIIPPSDHIKMKDRYHARYINYCHLSRDEYPVNSKVQHKSSLRQCTNIH